MITLDKDRYRSFGRIDNQQWSNNNKRCPELHYSMLRSRRIYLMTSSLTKQRASLKRSKSRGWKDTRRFWDTAHLVRRELSVYTTAKLGKVAYGKSVLLCVRTARCSTLRAWAQLFSFFFFSSIPPDPPWIRSLLLDNRTEGKESKNTLPRIPLLRL